MAEFSMDRVVTILREQHQVDAYVEQTGGGVATIYAGPTWDDPEYGERNAVVAGPGSFGWGPDEESIADTEDFYVGMDDDGVTDPETVEATATEETIAATIARHVRVNLVAVRGLHNRARGVTPDEPVEGVRDLSVDDLVLITTITEQVTGYKFGDALSGYAAFTGWDSRPRAERHIVPREDVEAVEVALLATGGQTGEAGTEVFRGLLRDAPFAGLRSGIYGVLTPAGTSLRARVVDGRSAAITADLPFVPGHPEVPMPDPEATFVSVYDPEDVDDTKPPIHEGMLAAAHQHLVPGTYKGYLPEQDVTVGLRVTAAGTDLVALVGAL